MFSFSQHATPFSARVVMRAISPWELVPHSLALGFGVPTMVKTTQIDIHDYICVDIKTYILLYISLALMLSKYLCNVTMSLLA